ncbi:hypothetical protein Q4561_18200 [Alteromonas sp. 1_MG-2023]|uniref:hypothetical protein n=1 Tax=Alteromonas sp. 1_MG-2023 TaxID=3062669 RepID=UPI0026E36D21|nr:hypothetical protein [Alteromonas sp. 1_MG-2023]MDO6569010.1 hypothetical protein [Alteromonas sp. 1_MG-2023]
MKYMYLFIFLVFSMPSFSYESLPSNCSNLDEVVEESFVIFSKMEFIQLGECLAENLLKKRKTLNIVDACNEVVEDKNNYLGILSLSKAESIKIGQCAGAIKYIYTRYDEELVPHRPGYYSSHRVYRCKKGSTAIEAIRKSGEVSMNRENLRDLLCD